VFLGLDVVELVDLVNSKKLSARELVEAAGKEIAEKNPTYKAFTAIDIDRAFDRARFIDEEVVSGRAYGRLLGLPFGVKDLEDTEGFVTTKGSRLYVRTERSKTSSPMVERLIRQGAIVVGKTNTPEFGLRSETNNALFGSVRSPLDLSRSAGGSSGGSAAAIGASMVPFATGSDGGGSIRIPSAACGLSGFKCSIGVVPTALARGSWSDLSSVGPMASTLKEVAYLLDEVAGPHLRDFKSRPLPKGLFYMNWASRKMPSSVLASKTLGYGNVSEEVSSLFEKAVLDLSNSGVEVTWCEDLFEEDPVHPYMTMALTYTLASLRSDLDDASGWEAIEPLSRRWLESVIDLRADQLLEAQYLCGTIYQRLLEKMKGYDLLVTPTTAQLPPHLDKDLGEEVSEVNWVQFTYPLNMARVPVATVPYRGSNESYPIGVQLVGRFGYDLELMAYASYVEEVLAD
jgi:Asp-tRNA(Asn)/Glu-tRNA(Gln) amidotransferase A subunit family amidase